MRTRRFRFCSYPRRTNTPIRRANPAALAAAALAAALPLAAHAQCEWVERNRYGRWEGWFGFSLAYDRHRERPVHFTYGTTWEWDGEGWSRTPPSHLNIFLQRGGQAMAYDTVRQRTMLFGGIGGDPGPIARGDLWEYNGLTWQHVDIYGPHPRHGHAMVYDTARQRLVVFGGQVSSTTPLLADTWEFDGVEWIERTPATASPPARCRHKMAFDEHRMRTVLYGGRSLEGLFEDTWEWDGKQWHEIAASGPSIREGHAMTYDAARQRTLLFGGGNGITSAGTIFNDLWSWDGAMWEQIPTPVAPEPRIFANMSPTAHNGQFMLVGGVSGQSWQIAHYDTWMWDGENWRLLNREGPARRMYHSTVYDSSRHEMLVVIGLVQAGQEREIWAWDGEFWRLVRRGGGPHQQYLHNAAFDQERGEIVYFGGLNSVNTWTWNGSTWTEHTVPGPSVRVLPAMAYDAARQRAVLFGGRNGSTIHADTWEWDGAEWTRINATGPFGAALATFDSTTSRIILLSENGTWAYDGIAWVQLIGPATVSRASALAYHPQRRSTIAFGVGATKDETWEFDGHAWIRLMIDGPSGRDLTGMAWDPDRERIVLFGGNGNQGRLDDTWELSCTPICYPNCDNSTAPPLLNIDDFTCFIAEFAAANTLPHAQQLTHYANCDASTTPPALNVDDFTCFINLFAAGCP